MFGNNETKRFATWFPGKSAARDRWGEPVGTEIGSKEFKASNNAATAADRMRWSLGHS